MIDYTYASVLMTLIFVLGYFFITVEHYTKVNKATCALLMAIACWIVQFKTAGHSCGENLSCLGIHIGNISQVIFFLLGALTVVEIISEHKGFRILADAISVTSKRALLWTVMFITFFLSSVLDNLTTTIVMISLLQKLLPEREDRLIIGGGVVIAANAGGAWTPIGDVTTTMLWIGGQLSTFQVMKELFFSSFACAAASAACLSTMLKGSFQKPAIDPEERPLEPYGKLIFYLGISSLIFVPVFKALTGMPPFMGMLFALGVLWLVTDLLHRHYEDRAHLRIPHALARIDLSGTMFFLGILLCVSALEAGGLLDDLAHSLEGIFGNMSVIAILLGLASAVVDNVPLVAATMSMYDLTQFPQDHSFWQLTAFAAGTGGSILIIGSAAGVVFMGLEKVDFLWYLRKISLSAAIGYFIGILLYFVTGM